MPQVGIKAATALLTGSTFAEQVVAPDLPNADHTIENDHCPSIEYTTGEMQLGIADLRPNRSILGQREEVCQDAIIHPCPKVIDALYGEKISIRGRETRAVLPDNFIRRCHNESMVLGGVFQPTYSKE